MLIGPLLLDGCHIGREAVVDALITTRGHRCALKPYSQVLDLSDARVAGKVEANLDLCEGRTTLQRAHVDGSVEIKRIAFNYVGTRWNKYINDPQSILDLQDARITGGLNIDPGALTVVFGNQENTVPNTTGKESAHERAPDKRQFITDLRGLFCDSYDDSDGRGWGTMQLAAKRKWIQKLRGEQKKAADPANAPKHYGQVRRYLKGGDLFTDDWPWQVRFDGIEFNRIDRVEVDDLPTGRALEEYRLRTLRSYFDNRPGAPKGLWQRFKLSCKLHFRLPAFHESESLQNPPHPYEKFAGAYLQRGEMDAAIFLIIQRNWIQWWSRQRIFVRAWNRGPLGWKGAMTLVAVAVIIWGYEYVRGATLPFSDLVVPPLLVIAGFLLISPFLVAGLIGMFGFAFGFGLLPRRAIAACVGSIALVSVAFALGDLQQAKKPTTLRPGVTEQVARPGDGIDKGEAQPRPELAPDGAEKSAMFDADLLLYSIDVFLPIVDLGQEKNYEIPADALWLRVIKAFASVLGWLVTSLTLLTVTGILMRDIDRSKR